jgi:hypothetical protein
MTPAQLDAIRAIRGDDFPLLQQVWINSYKDIIVKDYDLVWNDEKGLLIITTKPTNVRKESGRITAFIDYSRVFYLYFAQDEFTRDNLFQQNPSLHGS